jgi:ketosteroid isomerase-like protein
MTVSDHPLRAEVLDSVGAFNQGALSAAVENFASDVAFVAPGQSPVAGTYRGKDGVGEFFGRLHQVAGETLTITPVEVLANDEHMVLFLRFTAQRGDDRLDVTVAGFHSDRGPDGWRKATFLPDDIAAFDRFFTTPAG